MDERQLKKALENMDVPAADENAKKRALNLAMAEFDAAQKEKEKNSQGFSLLTRLTGYSNKKQRRETMVSKKKMIYGGMATAMVVVLAASITIEAMQNTVGVSHYAEPSKALMKTAEFDTGASYDAKQKQADPRERWRRIQSERTKEEGKADKSAHVAAKRQNSVDGRVAQAPAVMAEEQVAMERHVTSPSSLAIVGFADTDDANMQNYYKDVGRDQFEDFKENPIKMVSEEPVSTFSVDVDTASYSFIRRQLNSGVLPQKDAVRVEEMINYFDYDYTLPETKEQPFQPNVSVVPSPWKNGNKLIHIGIKGYDIAADEKPRSNLVFLLDVSGSMNSPDKLPLLKNSMKMLLDTLSPDDTVGIVVYAGAAGTVLEPTKASDKAKILQALENLNAGGSTAGAEGIRRAYQLAESNFDAEAVNRVILATDGDFNVGITNPEKLQDFVERERGKGIFLSVLGFGQGNYNDHIMQTLAQNGNGVAAYIDNLNEARKVLVEEASSTLFPIAKDVKIQIEFNPAKVAEYRLVGYETRHLNREDFNNDAVDAGDIGAGHMVTAIYEITPVGGPRAVDESRYTSAEKTEESKANTDFSDEYAFLKIRYKLPNEDTSKLITTPVTDSTNGGLGLECPPCPADALCKPCAEIASDDVRFSIAVAGFGQLLKGGKYIDTASYDDIITMAQNAKGTDEFGYRAEFVNLVRLAKSAAALPNTQQ